MQVRSELWKRCLVLLLAGIFCIAMLAGCSNGENSDAADSGAEVESSAESADNAENAEDAEAAADSSESEEAEIVDIEPIDPDKLQSIIDNAEPIKGDIQMSIEAIPIEEAPDGGEPDSEIVINKSSYDPYYIPVSNAVATSTLTESGYNHSVWNMLDWNLSTCWAEGNSASDGIGEGFVYRFNGVTRIDGIRIFPGYQKDQRVYRNNIVPYAIVVEAGGYQMLFDFEDYLEDFPNDEYWYCINIAIPAVYDDIMYVAIAGTGSYSNNPYYDCCITEFHPFRF